MSEMCCTAVSPPNPHNVVNWTSAH